MTYILCTLSVAYMLATISYFVITRFMGKPLEDSLSDEQREIKWKSVKVRGTVFALSFLIMLMVLFVCPLKVC